MRVEVEVTESSTKTWLGIHGHVEKREIEKLAESRCPESGGEMEARKTEIN